MTSKKQTSWPVPLRERDIGLGSAVREYARNTETADGEPAAYERMLTRLARRPRRALLLVAGFGMGAAAVLVTMVALHRNGKAPQGERLAVVPALPAPAPTPAREALPAPQAPRRIPPLAIRLTASLSALPAGKVELVDEASVTVSTDAMVRGRAQEGHTTIALAKGQIELQVLPRAPGHDFTVSAGDYRFVVVGTAFTVSQDEARLELAVREGKVAVWRGSKRLAMVGPGGRWSASLVPPATAHAGRAHAGASSTVAVADPLRPATPALAPSRLPATPPEPAAPPALPPAPTPHPATPARRDCGALAGRLPQEAMGCYQQQAAQGGLAGEAAQYEIARLWRDTFHDPARALAALQEQRSRFPRGVLAIEADLSIIELLPRLDRHAEALSESERFLKKYPAAERRGELHLLRGNIYREALRDFAHAEREYAQGSETRGRAGDESRFLRAVCLESLGRTQEARAAYGAYLSQPNAVHAQDAKKRLDRLGP